MMMRKDTVLVDSDQQTRRMKKMTDKMSKEEAKKEFDRWFNPDGLPNRNLVVYEVSKLIDAIEPEHKPVELPDEVGKWIDHCKHDLISISDALNHSAPVHGAFGNEMPVKVIEWLYDGNHQLLFAKGYLNGWTPEPEKHFVLPMVKEKSSNLYAFKDRYADPDENWDVDWDTKNINSLGNYFLVTQSDIDSAPAWVKAIKPVEVRPKCV
jgi:hypothetical protein